MKFEPVLLRKVVKLCSYEKSICSTITENPHCSLSFLSVSFEIHPIHLKVNHSFHKKQQSYSNR